LLASSTKHRYQLTTIPWPNTVCLE
jgi:hypothetical protein